MNWPLILEHLFIVLVACLFSTLVGLPLGIWAYIAPKARKIILWIVDLLQTIPALALLGIIMVFLGAGKPTVIIGITLYSLLPIVRNTYLGLNEVDSGVKEAARGMGMGRAYRIFHVELPLAFPTIFTGIRIAVVNSIGTAVFAAVVGGGGLGSIINRGIRIQNMQMILSGTLALMLIAVVLDLLMGRVEAVMRKKHAITRRILIPAVALVIAILLLLPYGLHSIGANELLLYDGNYTETQIMPRIVKYLVEDRTDITVTIQDQMSQVNNFHALVGNNHSCDMMISYDGTLLTTFMHLDTTDVPEDTTLYDFVKELAQERYDLQLLEKLGFDNTYAIAVPMEVAERYGLETISDLVPVADQLVYGAEHEFFNLEGTAKYGPFSEFYGLKFKNTSPIDVNLKYAAIEKGSFDVTNVFATDGLNRKVGLKVLEDDRNFFPDYNGAFLVRNDTFDKFSETAPDLKEILNLLAGQISSEDMVELTYQVDVLGRDLDETALAFLIERGFLSDAL